ncbi:MAG: tRNA preQ1(34) S-adenosylmethionine ribosyltransferase-isomerase QueA [Microcoleus sp. PH2017_10_PVI_O_A]|uniref:tRNA preQ1(34) S-adenosylmethionine ribosyltransferase-isomerase QueA n=1 Tax=unclassified Microcoleus TaxID=2642155 RepID=UPI001DD5C4E5|nr:MULTISPECIES: tRNA preQ1(34) S-adenosylmethionine ribosyltransferase-isomerase QueA [unclassified Microcoleus]TAE77516.1 MAG: tRNA preQ1(34) S-adenosylmethionine ribosyltransferase-isomerase QueA [Oscillatoriales cyanobacterium]MCC3406047.1 tRNA preQ1(34) S-adenosylmethionine ribosyltransferase-isomerase QueA [Microcoleus sp. PH2017_10_PVI_O_A]MCC3460206.1 tRNA preQ1(34) S-adenosylmethionine ribosyltransferase-isomerase QueA [Microcoleus sp. PH2017_11_PCY_U_A]MCC3478629.1 tRNA preQ1(34) S-ad
MTEIDWSLDAYDYELPPDRIAQNPVVPRDSSRLLVVDSASSHQHRIFRDLPDLLEPGDLLVLNNTRVLPARLYGHKPNGPAVEILLMEERQHNCWLALVKPGKRLKLGAKIEFEPASCDDSAEGPCCCLPQALGVDRRLTATVIERDEQTGGRLLEFDIPRDATLAKFLDEYGHVPLPPYIENSQAAAEQYQTVYAEKPGAVAAPTAGLHFTEELLSRLEERGIEKTFVTLHVGVGTFRPVEVADVTAHKMHGEWVEVSASTVEKIRETQARGGRIFAVGTTAVRALEGAAAAGDFSLQPFCGQTNLFIYPGYKWRVVDGMITNFHLPRSTLMMMLSAMVGRPRLLDLYREAIEHQYRFYSFGDAMLILPEARKD